MAAFNKVGFLSKSISKIKICYSLRGHYPTMPPLLTYAHLIYFIHGIQDLSLLCLILFHLPHNCFILSTLQPQLFTHLFFFTQHPIILHYTHLPHLPPCPPSFAFYATPPPPVSFCPSSPDGTIPVILSHYRSSDANGCTANPAAGSLDRCPYPLCPAP